MTKKCVFCLNPVRDASTDRERAREHVFAKWALREFDLAKDRIEFSQLETTAPSPTSLQMSEQTSIRTVNLDNFMLGNVCSRCNHGWMSGLEGATQQDLRQLIPGKAKAISAKAKPAFAKWALKTAFVLRCYLDPPIARIPGSHGRMLVGKQMHLPKGASVFHRQSPTWRVHFAVAQTWAIEAQDNDSVLQNKFKNSYKYVFQLGHAQFLVQFFPDSNAILRFDPRICDPVCSTLPTQPDRTIDAARSGVTDDLFLFAVSTVTRVSDPHDRGTSQNELCRCGSGIKFKRCCGARHPSRKLFSEPQGYDGDFMTGDEFWSNLPKK